MVTNQRLRQRALQFADEFTKTTQDQKDVGTDRMVGADTLGHALRRHFGLQATVRSTANDIGPMRVQSDKFCVCLVNNFSADMLSLWLKFTFQCIHRDPYSIRQSEPSGYTDRLVYDKLGRPDEINARITIW